MKKIIFMLIILLQLYVPILITNSYAKHLHKEKVYQMYWAGKYHAIDTEYILPDKARVDIVTKEYAIEVDFASKWAESIGQSLYYAEMMGLKPAVLLIVEEMKEMKFVYRIKILCDKYDIKLFLIFPEDLEFSVIEK